MSGDSYRLVTVTVRRTAPSAVLVELLRQPQPAWVPRSLLHAADDRALDGVRAGDDVTFRLRAWKAEELGLAGVDDRQREFDR